MIDQFKLWWRERQRRIDVRLLWPGFIKIANEDIDRAEKVFITHAIIDPAWQDFAEDEIMTEVYRLAEEE